MRPQGMEQAGDLGSPGDIVGTPASQEVLANNPVGRAFMLSIGFGSPGELTK